LQALFLGGKGEKLVEVARTDRDAKLRLAAIRNLGLAGKRWGEQLVSIYDADQDKSIRTAVIHALFLQSNVQPLIAIARKEANPELKREAVQKLSLMRSKEATEFMMELLNK